MRNFVAALTHYQTIFEFRARDVVTNYIQDGSILNCRRVFATLSLNQQARKTIGIVCAVWSEDRGMF